MPVQDTLARVEADMTAGDLEMACRRLRGLVSSFPERLDLREQLARAYRLRENLVQAGRWGYLADEPNAEEIIAFEKATADPLRRMYALMWPAAPEDAATPAARRQLATVLDEARTRTGDRHLTYANLRSGGGRRSRRSATTDRLLTVVAVLLFGLFVVGVIDGISVLLSIAL
jgi:hypothetical protein